MSFAGSDEPESSGGLMAAAAAIICWVAAAAAFLWSPDPCNGLKSPKWELRSVEGGKEEDINVYGYIWFVIFFNILYDVN